MINRYYVEQALRDLHAGRTYPDRWSEDDALEGELEEDGDGPAETRWWEMEGKTLADFPPLGLQKGGL